MKFHPFNIKYVEETKENEIIIHDDISFTNFRNTRNYVNFVSSYMVKDERDIMSLLHINVKGKDIYHGDIYLNKNLGEVYIYTFNKNKDSYDILGHGFFLLRQEKNKNKTQLIFDKKVLISVEDFINNDIVYIGNVFVHLEINSQAKDIINNELNTNKNYSLNTLKGSYKRFTGDFYNSTFFKMYFFDESADMNKKYLPSIVYGPVKLSKALVKLNDQNNWEIGIEKEYEMYNRSFDNVFLDSFSLVTGINRKTILSKIDSQILFNEMKNYSSLKNKVEFMNNYQNFFTYYNGTDVLIKSIDNNGNANEFIFDEKPIPYNIKDSFYLNYDKSSDLYIKELLKVI